MSIVTLTDGTRIDETYLDLVMQPLRQLEKLDNIALMQLLMKCEDPKYNFVGTAHHKLRDYRLLHPNYDVPDDVRKIVLCAVKEDGHGNVNVVSPIAAAT